MQKRSEQEHTPVLLRRYILWISLLLVAAFTFLDYWGYSTAHRMDPHGIEVLASGQGDAPAQYRVAMIYTAKFLSHLVHGHLAYRHFFAIFDFIAALCSLLLITKLLLRSQAYCEASPISQVLRPILLFGLSFYYFPWSIWYQRPETWTSVLFVVTSVFIISVMRSAMIVFPSLVILAAIQGFVRADVAILFHFGLFLYLIVRGAKDFPAGRSVLLAASCVSGLLSTAILWILMHKIFPHATYGKTKVFQLRANMTPNQFVPFLIFFIPTLYTYLRSRIPGTNASGPEQALRLSAVFYLGSWFMVGLVQEVRIFIPFAFALMPQTVNALANRLEQTVGSGRLMHGLEHSQISTTRE